MVGFRIHSHIFIPSMKIFQEYAEALKQGAAPAAYTRLMFLGAGGSGKSSLLDGLMNNPLRAAESTALADTRTVSYQWIKAADVAEEAWKVHSNEDEAKGLAAKSRQLVNSKQKGQKTAGTFIKDWASAPAVKLFDVTGRGVEYLKDKVTKVKHEEKASLAKSAAIEKIIEKAKAGADLPLGKTNPDVVMHIWDCGGQLVFLDILSAFLTPRTMFILLFDASSDINSKYQEKWHHNGVMKQGREQNLSHLQLMMQWLQLIHCSLVVKDDPIQQSPESEASHLSFLPPYPKAMLVGTHGDCITPTKAKGVMESVQSACGSAAFGNLIVDKLIVDNTTAGKGKEKEDRGYKKIRGNIHAFANSLIVDTPLAWVAFRQVVQETAHEKPILSFNETVAHAEKCGIPAAVVPNVLRFYHQLGAMLHYVSIPSLSDTIIVHPQWLIEQLRKLLMPSWYTQRAAHLNLFWKWLEERGVLLEELYQEIWKDCGLDAGAQGLADLLDHFDLAKSISHCPHDMKYYKGRKYFVPCILQIHPEKRSQSSQSSPVRQAATLHVLFGTGYVPPGFFVRLIARMTNHKAYTPLLENEVYRDSITFTCNEIDRVKITESLQSIKVNFYRKSNRKRFHIRFAESCVFFCKDLNHMCNKALQWLPSVEIQGFGFQCTCSKSVPEHFVFLKDDTHQESILYCQYDNEYILSEQHKFWLPLPPLQPVRIEDGPLTKNEVENVSKGIECGCLEDLVEVMEMQYSLEEAKKAQDRSKSLAHAVISDFAKRERETRYKLAQFLQAANFIDTSQRLIEGEMKLPASGKDPYLTTAATTTAVPTGCNYQKLHKQDHPTLLNLLNFPVASSSKEINIISRIGTHYSELGICLLEDDDGSKTDAIEAQFNRNASKINQDILKQWVQGKGVMPVTWGKLVDVLRHIGLKELPAEIDSLLI